MSEFSLAEVVLGQKEYASLRRFFIASWGGLYAFRAYITRRASNLNEIFFREEYQRRCAQSPEEAAELEAVRQTTFLTQNALLARIPRLTHAYIQTKKFPRLLIVDELIIYGREINSLMQVLESAILSAWEAEMGEQPAGDEAWHLHNAFFSAVDLFVYARNAQPLLLEHHLNARLHTVQLMSGSQWREYTQNVSRVISLDGRIDNTSYAPSYVFNKSGYHKMCSRLKSLKWQSLGTDRNKLLYHGTEMTVWQRNAFPDDRECHLHLTLRCYRGADHEVRMIPLPVFGNIEKDALPVLFVKTAALLEEHLTPDSTLAALLKNRDSLLQTVKLQLISCILSIVIIHDCLPQKRTPQNSDPGPRLISTGLDKVAQNFGIIKETLAELREIDRNSLFRNGLRNFLYSFLRERTEVLYRTAELPQPSFERAACMKHADEFFYGVGQSDEKYVLDLQQAKGLYNAWTQPTMEVAFDEYLTSFPQKGTNASACPFEAKIAVLLPLMDQGVVAMNMGLRGISLKAGEQSKFCRVRQMYRFVPALIELERYCWRTGMHLPILAAQFGRYLDRISPGEDFELLFSEFTREIDKYGQLMSDWDIDLIAGLDQPDQKRGVRCVQEWSNRDWGAEWEIIRGQSYGQYLFWERMNQKRYKQKAISFCEF